MAVASDLQSMAFAIKHNDPDRISLDQVRNLLISGAERLLMLEALVLYADSVTAVRVSDDQVQMSLSATMSRDDANDLLRIIAGE